MTIGEWVLTLKRQNVAASHCWHREHLERGILGPVGEPTSLRQAADVWQRHMRLRGGAPTMKDVCESQHLRAEGEGVHITSCFLDRRQHLAPADSKTLK